jgi:hypothetical protein
MFICYVVFKSWFSHVTHFTVVYSKLRQTQRQRHNLINYFDGEGNEYDKDMKVAMERKKGLKNKDTNENIFPGFFNGLYHWPYRNKFSSFTKMKFRKIYVKFYLNIES